MVTAGLVPANHVLISNWPEKTWMPGTKPGMTKNERTVYALIIQRAATHAASDRGQPRHRPRNRDPLLLSRLARHHLLAARVSGSMPVGRRAGGPHPGRSRRSRRHHAGDFGNPQATGKRGVA